MARDFFRAYSANAVSGGQIILRSLLEASVDLFNLCDDAGYAKNLEANDLREWLRLLTEAGTGENPYLAGFTEVEGLDQQKDLWEQELQEFINSGRGPLNAYERFSRAGMTDVYRAVYNWLCGYSHNSLRALTDRHMDVGSNEVQVIFCRNGTSHGAQWSMYLDLAVGLVGQGTAKALHLFGSRSSEARAVQASIEAARSEASRRLADGSSRQSRA